MSQTTYSPEQIGEVYDKVSWLFKVGWNADDTNSFHEGLWLRGDESLGEAIVNTMKIVADALGLKPGMNGKRKYVLDVGCGHGSTSAVFVADYLANCHGITASEKQYQKAMELYGRTPDRLTFSKGDYHHTKLHDGSFDAAFGVGSFTHATNPVQLCREMFRILKPGGILVIVDGFVRRPIPATHQELMDRMVTGIKLNSLVPVKTWYRHLTKAGFAQKSYTDYTTEMYPSHRYMRFRNRLGLPLARLLTRLGLLPTETRNYIDACVVNKTLYDQGLMSYGLIKTTKAKG